MTFWSPLNADEEQDERGLPVKSGEDFTMTKIDWLWKGWLARGKLHILAGAKGAGKSTIAYDFAARITDVGKWPDGSPAPLGDVIVWSGEDNIEDTILPRFVAAGGNLKHIYPIREIRTAHGDRPFDPSTDVPALIELATKLPNPLLCSIDPVVMALSAQADSHKNSETRRGLQPLVDFAEKRGIALLGITHFTKGTAGRDPVERITGSLAFGALPRCAWAASADEDSFQRRLVRIASNIGPTGGGIEYTLFQAPLPEHDFSAQRIDWGRQLKGAARELLNAQKRSAEAEAAAFLTALLSSGARPQMEVKAAADAHCHTWATVRRAQKTLGIKPYQEGKIWQWKLPERLNGDDQYHG
jgi:putative DNA primase/helicase